MFISNKVIVEFIKESFKTVTDEAKACETSFNSNDHILLA